VSRIKSLSLPSYLFTAITLNSCVYYQLKLSNYFFLLCLITVQNYFCSVYISAHPMYYCRKIHFYIVFFSCMILHVKDRLLMFTLTESKTILIYSLWFLIHIHKYCAIDCHNYSQVNFPTAINILINVIYLIPGLPLIFIGLWCITSVHIRVIISWYHQESLKWENLVMFL